jgi:hypothetical protein
MIAAWSNTDESGEPSKGFHDTLRSDVHNAATNVISWAAFGQKSPWARTSMNAKRTSTDRNEKFTLPVTDTLQLVIQNLYLILAAPLKYLRYFSPKYDEVFRAMNEFPIRIKDTIEERRSHMASKSVGTPGLLLDEMIKASSGSKQEGSHSNDLDGSHGLSEDELTGNVFVCVLFLIYSPY